jgi:hypothetical protein
VAKRTLLERLENVDRRILFVALAAAIVVPLLVPLPLPLAVTPMVRDLYDAIEQLPDHSIVLVSADYDPSGKPELEPFYLALMHQLGRKQVRVVIVSLWAPAPPLTEQVLKDVGYEVRKKRGRGLRAPGFKEAARRDEVHGAIHPADVSRTTRHAVGDIPMREVDSFSDIALLVDVSAGNPGVKEYVQVVQSRYGIRMVGACTAVSGPDYVPYYSAGQLLGLAAGMKGAAEYEKLVGHPGEATTGMAAQSASHVLLIGFIVFGNVMYFRARRRGEP